MWSRVFLATWTTGRPLWDAEVEDLVCKAVRGVTMRVLAGLMTLSLGVATSIGTLPACLLCSNLGPANQDVPRPGFFQHVACRAVFWRARRNSRTYAIRRVLELLWTHGSKVQARRQNTVRTAVGARLTTERLRPQEQRSISEELGGGEVLECHSVFPHCFGKGLVDRQGRLSKYIEITLQGQEFDVV